MLWRSVGTYHSYMDEQEAQAIDVNIGHLENPDYLRDSYVADPVLDLVRKDDAQLIYVNKQGIHRDTAIDSLQICPMPPQACLSRRPWPIRLVVK